MSDELVKNLRNMAEYNDRREFGADYKDDIHWKAADRIEELEAKLDAIPWEEIERLFYPNAREIHAWAREAADVFRQILALREQEEGDE